MEETLRRRRGHAFLPPKDILRKIPKLYATDGVPFEDKIVYIHYFCATADWWITELDQESLEGFGYAKLAVNPEGAEWGYIYLPELEELSVKGGRIIVERELHWTPRKFSEVRT